MAFSIGLLNLCLSKEGLRVRRPPLSFVSSLKIYIIISELAERTIASVLKTEVPTGTGGSNPSLAVMVILNIGEFLVP